MIKIFNIHNGCESNLYDSQRALTNGVNSGFQKAQNLVNSDITIFHSCTFSLFKEKETIEHIESLLNNTAGEIIVSGCFLKEYVSHPRVKYIKHENIESYLATFSKPENLVQKLKDDESGSKLKGTGIIQISKGCYGNCSFCSIKSIKGNHVSKPVNQIIEEIRSVSLEYGTIKLVGEEVAGYGRDVKSSLAHLFYKIKSEFPHLKIKFGSLNLKILKLFSEDELRIFADQNVAGNIHIPVQSSSTRILEKMSRGYSVDEYLDVYNKLKALGVQRISGDIICGFPTETISDHQKNVEFMKKHKFDFMEVFMFEPRPGTKAAVLPQIEEDEKKYRTTEVLLAYLSSYCKFRDISLNELIRLPQVFNTNISFQL